MPDCKRCCACVVSNMTWREYFKPIMQVFRLVVDVCGIIYIGNRLRNIENAVGFVGNGLRGINQLVG